MNMYLKNSDYTQQEQCHPTLLQSMMQSTASQMPSPSMPLRFPTHVAPSSGHNLDGRYGATDTPSRVSTTTTATSPLRGLPTRSGSYTRSVPSSPQGARPQSGMSRYTVLGDNNLMRYTGIADAPGWSRNTMSITPFSGWSQTQTASPIRSPRR